MDNKILWVGYMVNKINFLNNRNYQISLERNIVPRIQYLSINGHYS